MKNEIILFETADKSITLPVQVSTDTVWLNETSLLNCLAEMLKQ